MFTIKKFALLVFCTFLSACASITYDPEGAASWLVTNGTAFDRASIDLSEINTLVVPDDATIINNSTSGKAELFIRKVVAFEGHPVWFYSIVGERNHMGVATARENATLTLATFGEWDSQTEGGAFINLTINVPPALKVVKKSNLSKQYSVAVDHNFQTDVYAFTALNPGMDAHPG